VEAGQMTKDLAQLVGKNAQWLNTQDFLDVLDARLKKELAKA
jgi:isocitrate dehydrogenase